MKYGYKEKPALDFDYFSKNYRQYEEMFLKYSTMVEPPVFLNDDILYCMRSSGKNYFILNASNCNILRNIRFNFKLEDNAFANFGILHSMNRRILQYGVINQVILNNPARDVVLPRKKSKDKKLNYLDNKELKKFLTYLDGLDVRIYKNLYDITLYKFLLATGCRIGEALALEWSDIDLSNSYISVTKTVNSY